MLWKVTNSEPQLLPFIHPSNLRFHSARLSALSSIFVTPPSCCVCLVQWPPYGPPWYDPRSASSSRLCVCGGVRRHDPVLPVVLGTGAPSLHHHCSPPLAALHLHLLAPSMPSPRSQLSHMAHYPTATHHPSKSGSIHVSQPWCLHDHGPHAWDPFFCPSCLMARELKIHLLFLLVNLNKYYYQCLFIYFTLPCPSSCNTNFK